MFHTSKMKDLISCDTHKNSLAMSILDSAYADPAPSDHPYALYPIRIQDMLNTGTLATSPKPIRNQRPSDKDKNHSPDQFSTTEIKRIQRHFGHASAGKLYNLIRRSLGSSPPNTLAELEDIVGAFRVCIEFASAPRPVQSSIA